MTLPAPRAQRAYKLYVEDGLSLEDVARELHAGRRPVRRWILALGGKIRKGGYGKMQKGDCGEKTKPQVGPGKTGWRNEAKCSIGHITRGTYSIGDSWYCGRHCEHGRCKEEATVQDLAAFARLAEKREADDKLIKERKAKKLSGRGRALWR